MTSERWKPSALGALLGLVGVSMASCAWLGDEAPPGPPPVVFDHGIHANVAHMACADCHALGEDGEPGLPTLDACADCHDEFEEDEKVLSYLAEAKRRPAGATWPVFRHGDEIVFGHRGHARLACEACHGDVNANPVLDPGVLPDMDACVACHREQAPAAVDCASCHTRIRADVPPADHLAGWEWEHGQRARHGDLDTFFRQESCSRCHQRDTCTECHRQVEPRDHTNFFRLRGHGLMASTDRQSCSTCHRQDMCVRCHENTQPASHRQGGFGSSRNGHCQSCHEPLGEQSCGVCHTSTPSHKLAPPKSPRHPAGLNCRQCHGSTARLPHVDNGSDCNQCHH